MESKWTSEKETVEKLSYEKVGRRYCSSIVEQVIYVRKVLISNDAHIEIRIGLSA